jgi:hypothetical protein
MLRNPLLKSTKDMTTNSLKLMVLSKYINVLCCFGYAKKTNFFDILYVKTKKIYRNALRYILYILA